LPLRLALAAVSGVLCALLFRWNLETMWLGLGWFYYGTGGVLFGIAVLCPYLVAGPRVVLRALALIGASTLSYFCAVTIALSAEDWFSVEPATSFLLASFIGVTIVLVAARILIPLRVTATFWFLGLVASLVGGGAIVAGFLLADTTLSTILSFCLWQMLACVAIYRQPDDAESGLFAGFFRTRGRFSVVPGWMKLTHSTLRKLSAARA
jgi:hypothetical protein